MIPKFRGFRTKTEEWVEGNLIYREEPYQHDIVTPIGNSSTISYAVERDSIGQWTGLKDKNGVEIYGGDIVQMQWTIYDEPELFYIRTIEGRAPRVDNRIKGKELWLVHQDCKVVGNIYQNRELLEVAE